MAALRTAANSLMLMCLLLAVAVNARLLAQIDSSSGGAPTGAGSTSTMPARPLLLTGISIPALGQSTVTCKTYSALAASFITPSAARAHLATGGSQPIAFSLLICQDPRAAGNQLRDAVQAGGQQAQTAVYSLLNADCPDDSASSQAYSAAIDSVNSGDPADLQAVSSWFTNLATAADAVGIPLCASLAVVDAATGQLLDERVFPTGVSAPGPEAEPSAGGEVGTPGILTTSVSYSSLPSEPVACDVFDSLVAGWVRNSTGPLHGAQPADSQLPSTLVEVLAQQICSDPQGTAPLFQAGIQAGGQEAETWAAALFRSQCSGGVLASSANDDAFRGAIDAVNSGDPTTDLEPTAEWLSNLADAADAAGVPLCASLAVVDPITNEVLEEQFFYTSG